MARQVFIGTRAEAIVPNDDAGLPHPYAAVYVGGSGNVKVTTEDGDTVTFVAAVAGTTLPVGVVKVFATGTDATYLVAIW